MAAFSWVGYMYAGVPVEWLFKGGSDVMIYKHI